MEVPDIIWFLFAKKLAGEISASELQELRVFVRDNPAIEPQLETINLFWKQIPVLEEGKVEAAYLYIKQKLFSKRDYPSLK
ncbi:MAG: hypothetical protein JST87_16610 [Bacteroidetes bacterium]|nr:hypothetical protein [Bacteroidota bacterium]MBS1933575.1 hypothetical protein [Bacteroidota bacterium]